MVDLLCDVRPRSSLQFQTRLETAPGEQGQVDVARFQVVFTADRLAVLIGVRLPLPDLGTVRRAPDPADCAALPVGQRRGEKLGWPFRYICADLYLAEQAWWRILARLIESPNVTCVPLTAK